MTLEDTAGTGAGDQAAGNTAAVDSAAVGDTGASDQSTSTPQGQTDAAAPGEQTASTDQDENLIPDDEFTKLIQAGDPHAIRKAMNRSYTQKMRDLAAQRKAIPIEHQEAVRLVERLNSDPVRTLAALAQNIGLQLQRPSQDQQSQATKDEVREALAEALGQDAASKAMPAFERLIDRVVGKVVAPIKQSLDIQRAQEAEVLSKAAIDGLTQKHPNWKNFEPKMMELAGKLDPKGMPEDEYLDLLYTVASKDQRVADDTAKTIEKIGKAAKASTTPGRTVPSAQVQNSPKRMTFKEAAAMALRGERVED